jgi:uncharacterized protein
MNKPPAINCFTEGTAAVVEAGPKGLPLPNPVSESRFHSFYADGDNYLFIVEGSQIFRLEEAPGVGGVEQETALLENVFRETRIRKDAPLGESNPPPVHALSLAVAQKCNMGCTYCYAQKGEFGAAPQNMSLETALGAVDFLFRDVRPGNKVSLSFLGGEPLLNRPTVRAATARAIDLAEAEGCELALSITSNGTLIDPTDIEFFEAHGFSLTISLDGIGDAQDFQRPFRNGDGTYAHILRRITPALQQQHRMQVSARATITPHNLNLVATLDAFLEMGFHSVGFSPLLNAPTGELEMDQANLSVMLEQMIECGRRFETAVVKGERYPFLNMMTAMKELHHGTHRPYPCGAGVGYFGVGVNGNLYACHRFVNDEPYAFGNLETGVDTERQSAWLSQRNVDQQEPCRSCWARYLCGGGCHHEVLKKGRHSCDYIRGWLHYCLEAYARLLKARPDYFAAQS